jgi:hypothetical protein
LEIDLDFAAGELFVEAADIVAAAEVDIYYTPRDVSYDIDFVKRGDVGMLRLESELRRKSQHRDMDNEWRLRLSTRYPLELRADIGACEAEMDLGGLPITALDLDIGAASCRIEFSKPNPQRLREFAIDVGAASCKLLDLGNANAETMTVSCGAASCELDFRGEFKGETQVRLDVGVGSAKVILPRGVGVRVKGDEGWFSSIDFHGLDLHRARGDAWETDDFESNENRIVVEVDVGMGSVDFYSRR